MDEDEATITVYEAAEFLETVLDREGVAALVESEYGRYKVSQVTVFADDLAELVAVLADFEIEWE
jgi:hypothetical protein